MNKKLITYLRLHWLKISLIGAGVIAVILLVIVGFTGLYYFNTMDIFYRKMLWAQMPSSIFLYLVVGSISALISTLLWLHFVFGGGFAKMASKKIRATDVDIHWSDVIGMEAIKKEVWEVIRLIKDRAQLKAVGGRIIKGVLMVGPPGCGKTYLAKAIATETGLPFLSVVGSEFMGIFMGVGTAQMKSLFKEARILAEIHGGCIIFIDEIDSVARPRVADRGFGGVTDVNSTINQFLMELDGLRPEKGNIVVIGATNVPEQELDPALMRAGRFDRKIYIGLPGLAERRELFKYYLSKVQYDKNSIDLEKLARITVGNSPADISNIVREASLIAIREQKPIISMQEISGAQERIELGIKMETPLTGNDRLIAAYHEAGHTIATFLLVPKQDVFKATIIPHRGVGGGTWIMQTEERFIPAKEELMGEIKGLLGGYAAEKIQFGVTSVGVESDLARANTLAENMVTKWGMGTSGAVGVSTNPWARRDLSDRDREDIITTCLNEVNETLRKEKDILEEIAQQLIKQDELDYDELEAIFKKHNLTRLTYTSQEKKDKEGGITWDDVIGMEETKEEAKEIVSLIKDRAHLKQVGGRIIRGLLMFGPPGCGKTYLASAMANEAGVPFLSKVGSEFVEMYVGVGASRIRHMFQEARELALSKGGCIIFIDEIDALGGKRGDAQSGGDREYNQTLNQLLAEMDSFKEKEEQYNIVIIGATNVKEDFLDSALLRPGRFDRKITVDLPTFEDRKKLFDYYLRNVKYNAEEMDVSKLAGITSTWSPAEIANLVKEAALITVRNKKDAIDLKALDEARERIELGLKRKLTTSKENLRMTAYHEAGHCVLQYYSQGRFPFKVSIIPRTSTLGVAWSGAEEDVMGATKEQLLARIRTSLAGYVAEKIKFGTTTTGVTSDFSNALSTARHMVWSLGMGKSEFIGNFHDALYFSNHQQQPVLSEEIKSKLDNETQEILQQCLKETGEVIRKESALFEYIAEQLLAKEELTQPELEEIFKNYAKGKPPEKSL
ncbi:MAG: AAA family ATPase [Candidatus Omnitrophica bacterium]|nr:AAA family ATPase [Candidatus Omnitrophota bacterium]